MADGTTILDRRQLEQALLVLDRERPSPSDEIRFKALAAMVWTAIVLTVVWAAAFRPLHALAFYLIRAAASAYVIAILMLFANMNLVAKMWREAVARRRLRLLPYLKAFVRARHRKHLVTYVSSYLLAALGVFFCFVGAVGLVEEWPVWRDEVGRNLVVGSTMFGGACILTLFVLRWRDRVAAIDDLRSSLINGKRADDGGTTVPVAVYDEISGLDREQITQERRRNIAAARSGQPSAAYALRISRDMYAHIAELPPEDWSAISRRIQQLQAVDVPTSTETTSIDLSFLPVAQTGWEIGVRVDDGRREVQLITLRRGTFAPAADKVSG
jgi:hypothetical protein